MAKIKPEFDRRNVKIIGLSVDPTDKHANWAADIEETQGHAPNYPLIADVDFNVSKLYGMLGADVCGDPPTGLRPTTRPCATFRRRAGQEGEADPRLPDDDRPQLRRGAARDRLAAADGEAQGLDARQLAAGRRRDHRRLGLGRRGQGDVSGRVGVAQAVHPDRAATRFQLSSRRPPSGGRRTVSRGRARRAAISASRPAQTPTIPQSKASDASAIGTKTPSDAASIDHIR